MVTEQVDAGNEELAQLQSDLSQLISLTEGILLQARLLLLSEMSPAYIVYILPISLWDKFVYDY